MKFLLAAFLFILVNACTPKQEQTNLTAVAVVSTSEKNKELVKAVYTEMANRKNYALIDSFFSPIYLIMVHCLVSNRAGRGLKKQSSNS